MESTKKCKKCYSDIHPKANICPNCKCYQRNWYSRHRISYSLLFFLLILAFIGILQNLPEDLIVSSSNTTISDTPETFKKNPMEACTYAQEWVEKNIRGKLKNPKSLDFPTCSSEAKTQEHNFIKDSNGLYFYSSYYIAENSFGGNIRTDYSCSIKYIYYPYYNIYCSLKK